MHLPDFKSVCRVLTLAAVAVTPMALFGQDAPKAQTKPTAGDSPSRWDIFVGYSYLAPKDTVTVKTGPTTTTSADYKAANIGFAENVSYYFTKYVGWTVDSVQHALTTDSGSSNDGFFTISTGPVFRYPTSDMTLFAHALAGGARVGGPLHEPYKWGPQVMVGGGLDYETPLFNHRLAIRLFEADYEYIHENWGPVLYGGRANINAARLSAGVVLHVGSIEPPAPPTIACSASPMTVFPGDPVTVTANAGGLNPKESTIYTWSGEGVTGKGATAAVATGAMSPGTYTVNCGVKVGKSGKEGLKPWQNASATTTYTVKQFDPPTVSCSANPSTIKPGETSTITSQGVSPQNRPLTYNYSADSGSVSGTESTATFTSAGAPSGTVRVSCGVSDDKAQTASASTMVTIEPPPPPPGPSPEQVRLEARLALHSVFFPTNQPLPTHPDKGLVASQQGTLSTLATDFKRYLEIKPGAHLTLTGHADVRGSAAYNQALTERRVAIAKNYLVSLGVPESAIQTQAMGKEQQLSTPEVKSLVSENTELSDAERTKLLKKINVIVLAQNRRVDISLSTTGQQSVKLYPFNAADSLTLLDEKSQAPAKKAKAKQ